MATKELWTFRDEVVARVDLAGFELHALDGPLGTVAQSVEGSAGGYLVVDPGVSMPLGRQLLVPAGLVEKIEVDERRVRVRAQREQITNAPEFDPNRPLDDRSRAGIGDYYRPVMSPERPARAGRAARARRSARPRSRRASDGPTKAELYTQAKRLGIDGRSKMNKAQLVRAVARRRPASSAGGRRSRAKATPVEVQAFLEGVGYPVGKRQLVREAETKGAGREVRATLKRLPDKRFGSPTEVSKAIGKLD